MSRVDGVLMPVSNQWKSTMKPNHPPAKRRRAARSPAKVGASSATTAIRANEKRAFCNIGYQPKNAATQWKSANATRSAPMTGRDRTGSAWPTGRAAHRHRGRTWRPSERRPRARTPVELGVTKHQEHDERRADHPPADHRATKPTEVDHASERATGEIGAIMMSEHHGDRQRRRRVNCARLSRRSSVGEPVVTKGEEPQHSADEHRDAGEHR